MGTASDLCYWRELWRLTSVFNTPTCSESVVRRLKTIQNQLEHGLCYFKPATTESFTKLSSKHNTYPKVLSFIEKLQRFMCLDSEQTWSMFCHYLSNQCHGRAECALEKFTIQEIRTDQLIMDVWTFYNSERLFMLKQLKLILEFKSNPKYIYGKEFESIIESIGFEKLKKSLFKQLEYLVKEQPPSEALNVEIATESVQKIWLQRNLQEQVEVLSLLLLVIDRCQLSVQEFKQLFVIFKLHNFGRQPTYSKYLDESHNSSILMIVYSEVALFYKIVEDTKSANLRTVIQNVKEDVESELVRLQHNEEHGALLLAWMLLLLQDPQGEELFLTRYQHFGTKAIQLQVFHFLYKMTTHSMFSDNSKCASIFRNSVYHMLTMLCDKFDGDGSVAKHSHVIELCNELLKTPLLADRFWSLIYESINPGVVSLWNTSLEYFPYDFKTLSIFITGLSNAGKENHKRLLNELEKLPVYTELYKPRLVTVCDVMNDEDEVILTEDYCPHGDKVLAMKAGTRATILDRRGVTLIHFRKQVSYWRVLQNELYIYLEHTLHKQGGDLESLEKVLWGVRALGAALRQLEPGESLPEAIVGSCENVFDLLVRIAHSKTSDLTLIAACLDVSTTLVPMYTQKIFIRLMNIKLLPHVEYANLTHEEYANGTSYQSSLVGAYLVNVEQLNGEYQILLSYLDLLFAFYDCNYDSDISLGVLLPGLIFILKEVFPHISGWYFKRSEDKRLLNFKCVNYLFKILQLSSDQTSRPADLLLNRLCVYSLLNVDNGLALLKLISKGESNIQAVMEKETNWINGPGIDYIKTVQISMTVLMQVLRLKSTVSTGNTEGLGPLEKLIYTQPKQKDALKVVPLVTGYLNNVFNKQLPNTACRLLRRFALEFQMSLLVCLDMSPHQIRTMFLERLRDETESATTKTVILEFVSTCIAKQPGLTEAFFKISHSQDESKVFLKQNSTDRSDGILIYMAEYLAAVKNNTSSLYSPLLSQIMGLFHALWKNNMQMLVKDLRENPDFWGYLCSPLFQDILPDIRAYSQIFNMIAIELFQFEGKIDKSLKAALEKFFNGNENYLQTWIAFIFSFDGRKVSSPSDEVPNWLNLLTSWKDFISIVMKHLPFRISIERKAIMVGHCLDILNKEMEAVSDARIIVILAEMYAIFFANWKEDCFEDRKQHLQNITILLNYTAASYDSIHPRATGCILSVCTLSINMLAYDLKREKSLSQQIIRSICSINSSQLDKVSLNGNNEVDISGDKSCKPKTQEYLDDQLNPTVLGLKLLEQCIYTFKDGFSGWNEWFMSTRLINKLIFSVSSTIQKREKFKQTLGTFNCLTAYAFCSVSQDLLHSDINQNLCLQLLPPKQLLQSGDKTPLQSSWQVDNWRQLYKSGIEFITAVLVNHGNYFSSDAILFVGVHEEYITEAVLSIRHTLEMDALNLTSTILYLVSELLKFESKWRSEHNQSMYSLMRAINVCFHYCITMVLRPKGVQMSVETSTANVSQEESDNTGPSPKVATVLNKLLELINLTAVCLKIISPDLLSLLADPNMEPERWQPLMELHFGAPKISNDPFPQLTFGTVISAVCVLTRSLNYNYHADETPLNTIRKASGRRGSSRRRSAGWGAEDGPRRRALRSDSVTSLSSTTSSVTIGPGWLAALDKKIVLVTLENILSLLASQAFLATKDPKLSSRDKQLIRRELCTELPIFHDFVRKKVLDISQSKNYFSRKKFGCYPLLNNEEEIKNLSSVEADRIEECHMEAESGSLPPQPPPRRSFDSMRVSVVRKLHLDKTRTKAVKSPSPSDTQPSVDFEESLKSPSTPDSTLKTSQGSSRLSKHVTWDEISVSPPQEEELLDPEDPEFCPLSEVQIIEEDYFHFLSNLFLYFCQTDH